MTYNRQKAIKEIRQACIADDSTVSGRSIVLKDVLKSVPMEDGSFDRTEGNVVFISLAAKTTDAGRTGFRWKVATKSLTDQSGETTQFLSKLLKIQPSPNE
jgi:hypothetical protein